MIYRSSSCLSNKTFFSTPHIAQQTLIFLQLKVCFFLTHPSLQSSSFIIYSTSFFFFTLHPSILPTAMGGDQKLTTMVMKVDLDCTKCRKKIKRILCGIPQIQNQVYDDKANLVIITVLCCSPEKVMEKIRCRGGESVKGIEIVKPPPPKPKEPEKPKEKPKEPEKPKVVVVEKPKEKPKEAEKPSPEPEKPKDKPPPSQPKTVSFAEPEKPKQPDPAPKPLPVPAPQSGPPPPQQAAQGIQYCCRECYEGCGVGPCYSMLPAPPCYQAYGRPVYDSWGGGGGGGGYYRGGGYYVTRGECFSDDNPSGCVVM